MSTVGIVTGAGRGMGLACARRLSDQVDVLVLVDRDEATLLETTEHLSASGHASVEPFPLDVTDDDGLVRLASRASQLGTLRSVAHAAGISPTMADWRRIFGVDLIGTAKLINALRALVGQRTAIVCFASMAPVLAIAEADPAVDAALDTPLDARFFERLHDVLGPTIEDTGVAYAWAKSAVFNGWRSAKPFALAPLVLEVCSVSPGIIDTPQGRQEADQHPVMGELVKMTPLGRGGRAEELAAVVAFLLSDDASFLTGTDILVDGGVCAAIRNATDGNES